MCGQADGDCAHRAAPLPTLSCQHTYISPTITNTNLVQASSYYIQLINKNVDYQTRLKGIQQLRVSAAQVFWNAPEWHCYPGFRWSPACHQTVLATALLSASYWLECPAGEWLTNWWPPAGQLCCSGIQSWRPLQLWKQRVNL